MREEAALCKTNADPSTRSSSLTAHNHRLLPLGLLGLQLDSTIDARGYGSLLALARARLAGTTWEGSSLRVLAKQSRMSPWRQSGLLRRLRLLAMTHVAIVSISST